MARILLAEAQSAVQIVLDRALTRAGHVVLKARTGSEALTLGRLQPDLDVLVTDHVLPDMSGVDLLERLRDRFAALPAVIMTQGGTIDVTAAPDPCVLLAEPFTPDQLLNALAHLVRERGRLDAERRSNEGRGSSTGWMDW